MWSLCQEQSFETVRGSAASIPTPTSKGSKPTHSVTADISWNVSQQSYLFLNYIVVVYNFASFIYLSDRVEAGSRDFRVT